MPRSKVRSTFEQRGVGGDVVVPSSGRLCRCHKSLLFYRFGAATSVFGVATRIVGVTTRIAGAVSGLAFAMFMLMIVCPCAGFGKGFFVVALPKKSRQRELLEH